MKIDLQKYEYNFVLSMLRDVDKKSYDPVYKNIAERIEKMSSVSGTGQIIALEETDINNVLEALNEYIEDAKAGNYSNEIKKERTEKAQNFIQLIDEETGYKL
jgi:hypothetical protein